MNSATWTKANLKSVDASDLRDPDSKSTSPNFADDPKVDIYSYQPTASNGTSPCDDQTTACAQYTLTATLGGNSGTFIEKSLN